MKERYFGPVRFIPGENNGKYPFCNSIYVEGAGLLVDPASDRERLKRLRKEQGVNAVLLSHSHEDHFTHLDLFDDLPLWMSGHDAGPLEDLEAFLDMYEIPEDDRNHWRSMFTEVFHFKPRTPSRLLEDGEILELGPVTVEVLHTPGHTPGHLSLLFREQGVLFLGDYDLTPFGPWYGDRGSSIEQTLRSVERLREIPAEVWLTSHDAGVFEKDPGEVWDRYVGVVDKREGKLLDLLEEPRTLDEIVDACIVYGRPREPKVFFTLGERAIMKKHLDHLIGKARITRQGDRFAKTTT